MLHMISVLCCERSEATCFVFFSHILPVLHHKHQTETCETEYVVTCFCVCVCVALFSPCEVRLWWALEILT